MARRRLNGEGTITRWVVDGVHRGYRGALSVPSGGRRWVTGQTEREVLDKLRELQRDIEVGLAVGSRQPGTLDEYMREWLDVTLPARVVTGTFRETTLASYRDNYRLHIEPYLGGVRRDKLTPAMIRKWLATLLQKPRSRRGSGTLSPSTVRYCHTILNAAINDALHDEVPGFRRNPATLVEPPRGKGRGRSLTVDELPAILDQIERHRWCALWWTMLGTGLRRGEALSLHWSDIDLDSRTVNVRTQLIRLRGKGLVDAPTKTETSATTVALSSEVAEVLRRHRLDQLAARMEAPAWAEPNRVFTTGIGTAISPDNVYRAWMGICAAAGVRCRVHDLRHTMASLALGSGAQMKQIQSVLRHSQLATTADLYTHVSLELQRDAVDRVGVALRGLRG